MTDLSTFDPDLFLGGETTGGFETSYARVSPGEYSAMLDGTKVRKVNTNDGEQAVMDVTWLILDEEVKKETELERPTCRQGFFLDINDKGGLDRGKNKNVGLGRLLEALGINKGDKWSPEGLKGSLAVVRVEHKPNEGDPENPYANVTRVAAA